MYVCVCVCVYIYIGGRVLERLGALARPARVRQEPRVDRQDICGGESVTYITS